MEEREGRKDMNEKKKRSRHRKGNIHTDVIQALLSHSISAAIISVIAWKHRNMENS